MESTSFADIPWRLAIIIGLAAFLIGMGLQFGLLMFDAGLEGSDGGDEIERTDVANGEGPDFVTVLGWWHFSAQYVDIEGSTAYESESVDFVSVAHEDGDFNVPELFYRGVPVVTLIIGGFVLARTTRNEREFTAMTRQPSTRPPVRGPPRHAQPQTTQQMALVGASIAAGYFIAVMLGVMLFRWSGDGLTFKVSLGQAIVIAGFIYPILFGALGGFLATK